MSKKVIVIAPHPDDEILGVGGTMARLSDEGAEVYVIIATKGYPPLFDEESINIGRREALEAHKFLKVKETFFLSFPAANLDSIPSREINDKFVEIFKCIKPDIVFIPFNGDIHIDHQRISLSALVAARPNNSEFPVFIYAYETLSETNWNAPYLTPNFIPNVFIDISQYLDKKIEAFKKYKSQIKEFPNERSVESLKMLAMLRGSTVGCYAAEAFVLVRGFYKYDRKIL
jgi:LmbE family N-acetylglucosaminyl deacetylase